MPASPRNGTPALAEILVARLSFVLRGSLAGTAGGGLAGALLAVIAAALEPWTVATGPWLATTGFAAILAMALGAWSGARGGFLTAIVLLLLKKYSLAIPVIALLIGFATGLVHGTLASWDLLPSIQLEQPVEIMESIPFYVSVQLGAVIFTLWWMDRAG